MRFPQLCVSIGVAFCAATVTIGPVRNALATPGHDRSQAAAAASGDLPPQALLKLSDDFWYWRAVKQPYTTDDIPRLDRPAVPLDWSAAEIKGQRRDLALFDQRYKAIDASHWPIAAQVDYRLMGSALARVHWELDVNPRWQRDPTFYIDQTLGALTQALIDPPLRRGNVPVFGMVQFTLHGISATLAAAKVNLHPVRPLAELAIASLADIRGKLERVEPRIVEVASPRPFAYPAHNYVEEAIVALEDYRAWLQTGLASMPTDASIGREKYEYFLNNVALIPYTPEQMLELSRQEWARSVAFETYEKQRNRNVPELTMAATTDEEIARATRDEASIRKFLVDNQILTVPPDIPHYELRAMPPYLVPLEDFGEMDDLTSLSRLGDPGIRWIDPPAPTLGYFWLAETKDARPDIVHEGVPGHFFQMSLSRRSPDPIRRQYYDSGANEGVGFYAEEMMLQHGLFNDSPHTREIIYNFARLRALRVEVDVKLALGQFTIPQAAAYLETHVPMDAKTALNEASFFASVPGQAITYQIGKSQILAFIADARTRDGDAFNLLHFNDMLWRNGNVPITLQRWQYLGDATEIQRIDARVAKSRAN